MAQAIDVLTSDYAETEGTNPAVLGVFEVAPRSAILLSAKIIATRLSDGATKAWSLESLIRRTAAGSVEVLETLPLPANTFANATDALALAGATIAVFSDPTYVGVTCTGLASTLMGWSATIVGRGVTPTPP